MLEQTLRRYQNRAIEAAQVIEELIQRARELREANLRGEKTRAIGGRVGLLRCRWSPGLVTARECASQSPPGYPPDKQEKATRTVLEQAEVLSADWAA